MLLQIATAFSGMEDGVTKSALAVKLFGKSGLEMIPLLNRGAAGISQLTAEAEWLSVSLPAAVACEVKQEAKTGADVKNGQVRVFENRNKVMDRLDLPESVKNNYAKEVVAAAKIEPDGFARGTPKPRYWTRKLERPSYWTGRILCRG